VGVKTVSYFLFGKAKCECTVLLLKRDQHIVSSCFPPDAETDRLLKSPDLLGICFFAKLRK